MMANGGPATPSKLLRGAGGAGLPLSPQLTRQKHSDSAPTTLLSTLGTRTGGFETIPAPLSPTSTQQSHFDSAFGGQQLAAVFSFD